MREAFVFETGSPASRAFDVATSGGAQAGADAVARKVIEDCPTLRDYDVYLAGAEDFVAPVRERVLGAGLPAAQLVSVAT